MTRLRSIAIAGCLCIPLMWVTVSIAAERNGELALRWTFAVFRDEENRRSLFAVTEDKTLYSGDRIKFFTALEKPCYIYWIHLDSRRKIYLLHPMPTDAADVAPAEGQAFFTPAGVDWFRLDNRVGEERFYLLASIDRLDRLETLISDLSGSPDASAASATQAILDEIRRLRRQYGNFKRPAERPPTIMGQVRGEEGAARPDIEQIKRLATTVRVQNFYSKVFTIDHR